MLITDFHTRSSATQSICLPRWEQYNESKPVKQRRDPCGGCPLYDPCIHLSPNAGLEAFNRWIDGINTAAENLPTQTSPEVPPC